MKPLFFCGGTLAFLLGIAIGGTALQKVAQAQSDQSQSPEITAALQAVADARSAADSLKEKLLAPVHDTAAYKQAVAALDADQADLKRAHAAVPFQQDEVATLAQTILADENHMTELEQPALDASADWRTASAKLQEAIKSLQAADQSQQQQEVAERLQQQQAVAQAQQRAAADPAVQKQQRIQQLQQQIQQMRQVLLQPHPLSQAAQWIQGAAQLNAAQQALNQLDPPAPLTPEQAQEQQQTADAWAQQQQQMAADQAQADQQQAADAAALQQRLNDAYNQQRQQADEDQRKMMEQIQQQMGQ